MRALGLTLGLSCAVLMIPASARAEPISMIVFSATAGVTTGTFTTTGSAIDLGTFVLDGGSSALIMIDGLGARANVPVTFTVEDPSGRAFTTLTAEVLDPLSDGRHGPGLDPNPEPAYVPAGFSTSNNDDGLSFAWNSGLARSAVFAAGGTAALHVDEDTNAHDMLAFSGFSGGSLASVTFGLRDDLGNRGFLLRLSTDGGGSTGGSPTPEPASLLLLATGAVGLVGARRWKAQA